MEDTNYSFPSDIWSIGIVVFEMITGHHPYPETNNPLKLHEYIRTMASPTLLGIPNLSLEITDFVSRWY